MPSRPAALCTPGIGRGGAVELVVNRTDDPGTWTYGEGTVHHFAWNVDDRENHAETKNQLEQIDI
ncbi:hypothetical protein BKA01_002221 [Pseudonocardia eucalypti]|uniref:hypothetical protein n=1 Tax=Pseudonocardia eucalypti TaxID=648755 RepID=UPI00161D4B35|nr:hypothetical protein [Pseudonocardia eucalypti]